MELITKPQLHKILDILSTQIPDSIAKTLTLAVIHSLIEASPEESLRTFVRLTFVPMIEDATRKHGDQIPPILKELIQSASNQL